MPWAYVQEGKAGAEWGADPQAQRIHSIHHPSGALCRCLAGINPPVSLCRRRIIDACGVTEKRLRRRDGAESGSIHDGEIDAGGSGGSEPPRRLMRAALRSGLHGAVTNDVTPGSAGAPSRART